MSRPVEPKEPSMQMTVLLRMRRQVEMDERIPSRRKKRIQTLLNDLLGEFQKELQSGAYSTGVEVEG